MPRITLNDLIIPKHDELLFDVLDHKHTHYTLYGGRGGVKSSFIGIAIPLLMTQNPNAHAAVFRKVAATLRDSVYAQISFGISMLGMDSLFKKTVSPMEITYKPTGQKILFRGLDEPEKIKSIKTSFGYIGITWFEEVDQMAGREEIRKVLQSTMRGKDGVFWNFESFNPPISAQNWANKELRERQAKQEKYKDYLCVQTSYLDVPADWLSEKFFEEADFLKEVNPRAYEHEYLGVPVGTGTNIFENLKIKQITDAEINTFSHFYYGLDFGWVDPTALVEMSYNHNQQTLYIINEIFRYKTPLETFAEDMKKYLGKTIIADSAEPRSINTLRSLGFTILSAEKGNGSLDFSFKWLQSLKAIIVDPVRCPKTAEEMQDYEYPKDKDGNVIGIYPDGNDHGISAVRYALTHEWKSYPKRK